MLLVDVERGKADGIALAAELAAEGSGHRSGGPIQMVDEEEEEEELEARINV
jgi:hypothetical protein